MGAIAVGGAYPELLAIHPDRLVLPATRRGRVTSLSYGLEASMRDIGPGCEGVDLTLDRWVEALMVGEVQRLEDILAEDFQMTCDPAVAGGRMNKAQFIAFDSHIRDCTVELLSFVARRYGGVVVTQVCAKVDERFEGDPVGATADQLMEMVGGRTLAYASAWRPDGRGGWRCFQHHLFGPVD